MPGAVERSTAFKLFVSTWFLLNGTGNSVLSKLLYNCKGLKSDGSMGFFEKPWFQVWAMFMGMSFVSVFVAVRRMLQRRAGKQFVKPLVMGTTPVSRVFFKICLPASCDLIATFLQSLSLVFTNASIWQMLRGSIIIFSAIIRRFYLKKGTKRFEMVGIALVVAGLVIVGMASLASPSAGASGANTEDWQKALGVFLVLAASATQGCQMVVEEKLLHDVEADAMFIVAIEGFWGVILTTAVFMPIAQLMPGVDGKGVHEDVFPDDFFMPLHSGQIAAMACLYMLFVMSYNMTGMLITQMTQATTRNVLDSGRTLCVWVAMVIIYTFDENMGEELGWYSWIELAGFFVLVSGMFTYYKVVKLPWASLYPDESLLGLQSPLHERGSPVAVREAQRGTTFAQREAQRQGPEGRLDETVELHTSG